MRGKGTKVSACCEGHVRFYVGGPAETQPLVLLVLQHQLALPTSFHLSLHCQGHADEKSRSTIMNDQETKISRLPNHHKFALSHYASIRHGAKSRLRWLCLTAVTLFHL